MTNDIHLLPDDSGENLDPDSALIAAYLARELSAAQIVELHERFSSDEEFRAQVQPLIAHWVLPQSRQSHVAAGATPAPGRTTSLTRAEIDAGWQRHLASPRSAQRHESGTRTPQSAVRSHERATQMTKIAATIALVVLPFAVAAQLVVFAANNPGVPGHTFARSIVPSSWRALEPQHVPELSADDQILFGDGPIQLALVPPQQTTQTVPIFDLAPATARTAQRLMGVVGLQETPDGRLLVNDAPKHQIWLFDKSLSSSAVVVDSAPGSARSYGDGNVIRTLVPYLGDSLLFLDIVPGQMLVLDPIGTAVRSIAVVMAEDNYALHHKATGVDARGRLVYPGPRAGSFYNPQRGDPPRKTVVVPFSSSLLPPPAPRVGGAGGAGGGRVGRGGAEAGPPPNGYVVNRPYPDTIPMHRTDFEARRVDTVGFMRQPVNTRGGRDTYGGGKLTVLYGKDSVPVGVKQMINPLFYVDDFAVLSDGTVALVRGNDYRVDWIHPDGTKSSSPKLPFEWQRLTDDDKKRLTDSTRADVDSLEAWAIRRERGTPAPTDSIPAVDSIRRAGGRGGCGSPGLSMIQCPPERHKWPYEVVPFSEIADYWPPFKLGAAIPDEDGNLWILPRTTTQSRAGELVYDVVHPRKGFLHRVRLPLGRSIAGFGKGGVVYLQYGDLKNGFILERTTVVITK